ncbi:MAG: TRAP transporter large permease [Lachnospiraceae bacterium]|nr:TRAP transporter large permease [Lachnospiraceae bacterium]
MRPELIGLIGLIVLLILLALKMWVGAAMLVVSIVGIIILKGMGVAETVAGNSAFSNLNSYTFTVIPMFTLMGMVIAESTMGQDLYACAYAFVGRFRGGLASATVVACGVLGAITGSTHIATMVMAKVAVPEMKKNNYDETFALGSVAAGAPLAILIPPSIGFIIFGILTENSIGKLFMSGFGVGIVQIVLYIILIWFLCLINPKRGPKGPKVAFKIMMKTLLKVIPILLLMALVLGGIYGGFFTTTEAGAIGAFGSIVIAFAFRQLTVKKLTKALKDTAVMCGMVFFLVASTYIFVSFMSLSRVPMFLANFIAGLTVPNWVIAAALIILYFILGMFLPDVPMIVLTVPVLYTALIRRGFDPIWLGAFVVKLMAVGGISPPVGMTVFTLAGTIQKPAGQIFKGVLPFLAVDVVILILMIVFPQIATFIPSLMG